MGRRQVVRQRILIPSCGGSNPPAPASPRAIAFGNWLIRGRDVATPGFTDGSRFKGSIREDANAAFGLGSAAGATVSRCKALRPGSSKAVTGPGGGSGSRFEGSVREGARATLGARAAAGAAVSRARHCVRAVRERCLAWAVPPAHGSRDQYGKVQ